jgi:FkbH-like protein
MRSPFKVITLDCDNTLWRGICGEDGPEAVVLDPSRRALHEFMLEQREDGMLLTMASKNNESDVMETFSAHPEMPLQPRHFVGWRLNWEPKPEGLSQLAEELGLGLDSFIFIDDNPKECAELEGAIPEVLTLALPENIEETPHFLKHVWAFDHPVTTEEDRNRSVYYQQQQEFGAEVKRSSNLEDFMATLDLKVSIAPLHADKLARLAQLTQRTNQFNLTGIRRSEADIQGLERAGYGFYTVDVSDRFGDYGVVGVLTVKPGGESLEVDSFMLSCRALGRGVEHRMLAFLGQIAVSRGFHEVTLRYVRTVKNSPAEQFLKSVNFGRRETKPAETILRLPASEAANFRWTPAQATAAAASRPEKNNSKPARRVDYAAIARFLATAEAIRRQVSAERASAERTQDMSDVEGKLAHVWSELLERGNIGRNDNFFDLGAHSLLAVLLLLRIRETFDVDLSIDDVYSGTLTLADLASRIETAQLGDIDPEEYAALLAEIDNMSDEQARDLLAREEAEQT